MITVKILKRKDMSSVVVAIALGMSTSFWLMTVSSGLTAELSRIYHWTWIGNPYGDLKNSVLYPTVMFAMQLVLIELLINVVVLSRLIFIRRKK